MFEYDPEKSDANKAKHGVNFEEAQALWLDDRRITIASEYPGEPRWIVVGMIGKRLWTAAITFREDVVRIISVRRARKGEMESYVGRN